MLNKNNLNIAKLADEAYRPSGILVTPQNTVVTDGRMLMVISNPALRPDDFPKVGDFSATADFEPFLLPAEAALNVLKVLPKKQEFLALNCAAIGEVRRGDSGQTASLMTTDLETSNRFVVQCLDGQFPHWENIVPDPIAASLTMRVDARCLIALLNQFVAAGSPAVTLRLYTKGPIRLDGVSSEGQHITGLLMPMRIPEAAAVHYGLASEETKKEATK